MTFFIILYIIFLTLVFFFFKKNHRLFGYEKYDFLLPINIILFFSVLATPYMFYIVKHPDVIYTPVDTDNLDNLLFKYILLHIGCIIFFIIGTVSFMKKMLSSLIGKLDIITVGQSKNLLFLLSIIFYLLSVYNFKSLQLDNLFQIFINRNENISKLGYIYFTQQVIGYYVLYLYLLRDRLNLVQKINLGAFFITFLLSSLLTGGRTQILYMLIFCFIVIQIKRPASIKQFFKPKYILLIALFFGVMYIIPKFRGTAAWNNEGLVSVMTTKDENSYQSYQLLSDMSGLDRYLFIIDMFDRHGFWYGEGYVDVVKILLHPIIRSDVSKLPKGDDGLYLAVMSNEKRFIDKPYRVDDDYMTSFPVGNYAAYMNFGAIGLLIAYFLLGGIANTLYQGCKKGRFKYIYFYTLFISGSVAFSNIGFLNIIINSITLVIVFVIIRIFSPGNIKLQR